MAADHVNIDVVGEARRKRVRSDDDEIDVDPVGRLLRTDLAWEFRRRRLGEGIRETRSGLSLR